MNDVKASRELALHYMKTLADVARESIIILGPDLRVITANPIFYQNFQVEITQTEGRYIYELGNKQWNIPQLRKLLEEILPEKHAIRDFMVDHVFESIGKKTIQLNAQQIDSVQLIILALEDITARKLLESQLAEYTNSLEDKISERTKELTNKVKELESLNKAMIDRELKMIELKKEIEELKREKH